MVESVQTSVYRRTSSDNCRSLANPTGNVCWAELTEQWVYGQPLAAPPVAPTPPLARPLPATATSYPVLLEPERLRCDEFIAGTSSTTCASTAADFYKVVRDWGASPEGSLIENVGPFTTFLLPHGKYTLGKLELAAARLSLIGGGIIRSLENRFLYKPIDPNTVILLGSPTYSVLDSSGLKSIESVQTAVYHRQTEGADWVALTQEWVYAQPLLGTSH